MNRVIIPRPTAKKDKTVKFCPICRRTLSREMFGLKGKAKKVKSYCKDCEPLYYARYRKLRKLRNDPEGSWDDILIEPIIDPWYAEEWERRYNRNLARLVMMIKI
jgi:hypothetical protein